MDMGRNKEQLDSDKINQPNAAKKKKSKKNWVIFLLIFLVPVYFIYDFWTVSPGEITESINGLIRVKNMVSNPHPENGKEIELARQSIYDATDTILTALGVFDQEFASGNAIEGIQKLDYLDSVADRCQSSWFDLRDSGTGLSYEDCDTLIYYGSWIKMLIYQARHSFEDPGSIEVLNNTLVGQWHHNPTNDIEKVINKYGI